MERLLPLASPWRNNLLLTLGVVATVLMALMLAVSDGMKTRLPAVRPTDNPPDTVAVAVATTMVPPTISLPTATPTEIPPTVTPTSEKRPSATAVPVRPKCGDVPDDWVAYTVLEDDTLLRLAMDSGATASSISVANCLESNRIFPGMTLYLPAEPPPPPPVCTGPPSSWVRYTVRRGDTLYSLARSRGATVYDVLTANCLVGIRINAGQVIYLPPGAEIPATPTEPSPTGEPPPTGEPSATQEAPPPPVASTYNISSPSPNEEVRGIVQILGTANFDPNEVRFYKLEIGSGTNPTEWITFGQTHSQPVVNGVLEQLHADGLAPGPYVIRLVLVLRDSNFTTPYTVPITVVE